MRRARYWGRSIRVWMVSGFCAVRFAAAADVSLKVMSFNILEDTGVPSATNPNRWIYTGGPDRRDRVVRLVAEEAADLVGIQEAEPNQVADLTGTNALAGYGWCGAGRLDGLSAGQHELILYRTNRFTRLAQGVFWLSLTPDTPGSKHPAAALVRIAVWARLLDRWSGRVVLLMNTHWDYSSAEARLYSAGLMRSRIAALASNGWTLVTGDLNMYQDEAAYSALRGTGSGGLELRDGYRDVVPSEQPGELTRHDFNGGVTGRRVDYTFGTSEFAVTDAAIVRTTYDGGRYPSDHYPVTATLRYGAVRPVICAMRPAAGGVELAWSSVSGLAYRVRASTDLSAWADVWPVGGAYRAWAAVSAAVLPIPESPSPHYYRVVSVSD